MSLLKALKLPVNLSPLAVLPEALPNISCFQALDYFQTGRAHLLVITEHPGDLQGRGVLGVATLEDVLEEILGEEIIDESDRLVMCLGEAFQLTWIIYLLLGLWIIDRKDVSCAPTNTSRVSMNVRKQSGEAVYQNRVRRVQILEQNHQSPISGRSMARLLHPPAQWSMHVHLRL